MKLDSKIYLITGDLGYGLLDTIRNDFPDRFINVGAAEMLMIGTAIGLSYSGFKPVCYSITPFLLYRPFEMIRNYINYEKLDIKLVGGGRDKDYEHDGITHWACDDMIVMKCFPNIRSYKPNELTQDIFNKIIDEGPCYINLRR
jgi:transketolase